MTQLETWAHIFAPHFSKSESARERETRLIEKALSRCDYDFNLLKSGLERLAQSTGDDPRVHVRFAKTPWTKGQWFAAESTVVMNSAIGPIGWPVRYMAKVFLHELGHVVNTCKLDGSDEDKILNVWCPPIPGQSTHGWMVGNYRDRVGEAFADAWAHIYSNTPINFKPESPIRHFFRWRKWSWGHHEFTPEVETAIRGACE